MKNMQSNLTDMGGSVQVHSEILQQATITVSGLNENLDTAVASSKYLRDSLSIINLLYDLALRIGSFTASLIMGYILPNPTLYRNAGLLLGGKSP